MTSTATPAWRAETDADGITWLSFDKPGSIHQRAVERRRWRSSISHLEAFEKSPPRGLVIRSAKASGFIAGADVREFAQLESAAQAFELVRAAQRIFDRLEALRCPTVAIIHGFALGGGFELALACRYRVGVRSEKFSVGLPEVMLGIHPGFGGTVRAVRRAGVRTAMEMMLTGKTLRADKAKSVGLHRQTGLSRRCRGHGARADQPPAQATQATTAGSRAVLAAASAHWSGSGSSPRCAPRLARSTILLPTPSSTSGRSTARVAKPRTKPKRAPSPDSWSARPRAIWCACSRCRIGSRTSAARASCRSSACTWWAPA